MTLAQWIWTIVKLAVMIGFLINVAALLTWLDRRQSAMMQDRVGPNRAVLKIGKFELRVAGLLHTAADGLKFFFKEDFVPPKADKLLFGLAPILSMMPVLALVAVIPMGDTVFPQYLVRSTDHGYVFPAIERMGQMVARGVAPVDLAVAPLSSGILFIFALAGQGIVGAAIAGWSSDNKFSLMGALRAASQMVSYEVTIGLSLIGAFMLYGTVRLEEMVRWQGENCWGLFAQPAAFFLFFASAVAESKRIPFDLPEAESELVSGYFTEYSGMKFGMFYFAEYMEVVTSSMLLVTIFLGGWQLPFFHRDGITIAIGDWTLVHQAIPHIWMSIIGVVVFFGKVLATCVFQAFVRWSLPRFRYDQLMKLGWRVLLPLSLGNLFLTGVILLVIDGSPEVSSTLKVAADISQLVVALVITLFVLRGLVGFFAPKRRSLWIVGTSAEMANARGGTVTGPMQL
ncbi:NADH-quinone oxidoreductase subunit H [Pendulispora albinea]|uniref:NADH-quinone oxidoreductase subunit H n=1 Tax=Pendulispora albinea TaxID=2741071 RepID=A0ABZ2M4P1_9BACT